MSHERTTNWYAENVRATWLLAIPVSGCAIVSGLDGLDVCDGACADVLVNEAGLDADGATDANLRDSNVADVIAISDATDDIACTKPSDCVLTSGEAGTKVCCATINTFGVFPSCTYINEVAKCATTDVCPTSFPTNACGSETLRRCSSFADCTEALYPKCCVLPAPPDGGGHYCANLAIATTFGGACP